MSSMETAAAFPLRAPPKLVTRITIVHLIEMIFAGILMVFVVLPAIFKFSLVNASFWQIYGRFYVTGLFGTFFYVALTLPLSVVLGFLMGWARVQSVPKGQLEAAQALGLRPWQGMRHVILPQTFRLSLPPLGNEFAGLIKDTSILAAIAGTDLVAKSRDLLGILPASGFPIFWIFAVWTVVAVTYFVLTYSVTRGLRLLERKFHTPGLEGISL